MLLYARRYGTAFATIGGVLLVLMPDNIRVAFAEGNLPRVFAAALLPAAFFCLLNVLTGDRWRGYWFAGLAGMLALVILSHAMMGAIFGACFSLFVVVYWTRLTQAPGTRTCSPSGTTASRCSGTTLRCRTTRW